MSTLPQGWIETELSRVADWGSGGTPKAGNAKYYGGGIPWAVIGDLTDGLVNQTASTITAAGLSESSAKLVEPGTVLLAMYGSIGKLGIAGVRMATNQAIAFARPKAAVITAKYLFYYLLSIRDDLIAAGKGATQRNISQTILKPWPIPLPPLVEQHAIVEAIEEEFSRIEDGANSLKQSRRNVDRMRAAVLQAACAGDLVTHSKRESVDALLEKIADDREERWCAMSPKAYRKPAAPQPLALTMPAHWRVASLEALTDPVRVICYGILMPRVREQGEVPYVEVKDLRARRLTVNSLHRTSRDLDAAFARSTLRSGDVVLAIRGSFDRALVVPAEVAGANVSRDVARIAPLDGVEPRFLATYLVSPASLRYLREQARGVAVKGVNIADLRSMPVPLPPREEQAAIVEEVDRVFSMLEEVEAALGIAARRATSLRASVLSAAFAGRLHSNSSLRLPPERQREEQTMSVAAVLAVAN